MKIMKVRMRQMAVWSLAFFALCISLNGMGMAARANTAPEAVSVSFAALSPDEQAFYLALEDACQAGRSFFTCYTAPFFNILSERETRAELAEKVLCVYRADHPEEMRLEAILSTRLPGIGWIAGWIQYSPEITEEQERQGLEVAEQLCQSLQGLREDEQLEALYRLLTSSVTYAVDDLGDHTIYAALVEKSACCEGIANTMSWCLTRLGIENQNIIATMPSGKGHIWNRVKLNRTWYELDPTWDLGKEAGEWDYYLADRLHSDAIIQSGREGGGRPLTSHA